MNEMCPIPGCSNTLVRDTDLVCDDHWKLVPEELQVLVRGTRLAHRRAQWECLTYLRPSWAIVSAPNYEDVEHVRQRMLDEKEGKEAA
jgi:hypothetical protein